MSKKTIAILIILGFVIVNCNKKNIVIVKDNNGKILQKGKVDDQNFKTGLWNYYYGKEQYDIFWKLIDSNSISFNIPNDWEKLVEEAGTSYFGKIGETKGQIAYNISYNKTKKEYDEISNNGIKLKYDILDEYSKPIIIGNKEHIFSKYTLMDRKTKKYYYLYNFIAEIRQKKGVVGVSYFFKDLNWQKHSVFFLDYIYSFKLEGEFLLDKTTSNKGNRSVDNSFFGWRIEIE